jgi:hypothetical protein
MEANKQYPKFIGRYSLPSLICQVRYAHFANQTPRQKMANAIIWLCPPTTLFRNDELH